jgi:hypothetical protein
LANFHHPTGSKYPPPDSQARAGTPRNPYRLLGLAVLANAIEQASQGDPGAMAWLEQEGAAWVWLCIAQDRGSWPTVLQRIRAQHSKHAHASQLAMPLGELEFA